MFFIKKLLLNPNTSRLSVQFCVRSALLWIIYLSTKLKPLAIFHHILI